MAIERLADSYDLILTLNVMEIGERCPTTFGVVKSALCLASPVFNTMLRGPYRERNHSELQLDDDVHGLRIFLAIVHLRFNEVKTMLTLDGIARLTVIVDKYDAVPILDPWISRITMTIQKQIRFLSTCSLDQIYQVLAVSWTLKMRTQFSTVFEQLITSCTFDEETRQYSYSDETIDDKFMPGNCMGK